MKKVYIAPTSEIFMDELPVLLSNPSPAVNNEQSDADQEAREREGEEENAWDTGTLW